MEKQIFIRFFGRNQSDRQTNAFVSFPTLAAAESYVLDWLEQKCGVECLDEATCAQREAEGEHLVIPRIDLATPADLTRYRGIYFFQEEGTIALDLDVVWDEASAQKFRGAMMKDYRLDQIFTDEADEMMDQLDVILHYFQGQDAPVEAAADKIRTLIRNDGVAEF